MGTPTSNQHGSGTTSVRLYVVVPVRVKTWLELEASRQGLSMSAVVRRELVLASGRGKSPAH